MRSLLLGLGANDARIVQRSQDKGGDILASFVVAGHDLKGSVVGCGRVL